MDTNEYIAGAVGGVAGLFVGHPFDTTKVNYQIDYGKSKGSIEVAKTVSKHGMKHGLFRGLGLPLVSYGLVNSVYFGVYGNTLNYLNKEYLSQPGKPSYTNIGIAGLVSGAAQVFVACPTEVIKVRLQSQVGKGGGIDHHHSSSQYDKGPIDSCRKLLQEGGSKRIYRGFTINIIRDLPASAMYFLSYTWFMANLSKKFDKQDIIADLISGGMAGVISWYIIMPFDVIKSRMQADTLGVKYKTTMDCVRQTYRREGIKVFMRGAVITALRAFPVNAVTMLAYQKCIRFLNQSDKIEDRVASTLETICDFQTS